jgi:SAM-dependent methyltransferase
MPIDFGLTAPDYLEYRRPFPQELFRRLQSFGIGLPEQSLLDVGAGSGALTSLLRRLGCKVIALDISRTLLTAANAGPHAVAARAERLPFAQESFDGAFAAQSWHWFDRQIAPPEILRVLRPGGVLAVLYQMYVPIPGTVAAATERLILEHQPRWRHANSAGINGQVLRDMQQHGFTGIESFSFDTLETFTHEQWRGFIRTTSAVGASMSADKLKAFDRAHADLLTPWPELLSIPHRVFAAIAHKPATRV